MAEEQQVRVCSTHHLPSFQSSRRVTEEQQRSGEGAAREWQRSNREKFVPHIINHPVQGREGAGEEQQRSSR